MNEDSGEAWFEKESAWFKKSLLRFLSVSSSSYGEYDLKRRT